MNAFCDMSCLMPKQALHFTLEVSSMNCESEDPMQTPLLTAQIVLRASIDPDAAGMAV